MACLTLTNSKLIAEVDECDLSLLLQHKWHISYPKKEKTYHRVRSYIAGKNISLHRFVMNPAPHEMVDHINGNPLDNRKENLRVCNTQQNHWNTRNVRKNKTSTYKGVSMTASAKFRVDIKKDGKAKYCGTFPSALEAAYVYDAKARELFGEFACLNFPEKSIDKI